MELSFIFRSKLRIIMQADVLNIEGKKTGRTVDLPEEIFGIEPNDHVIYLAVKQYLAAQRQGTGGSRKGNLRNPLYKGGGTIFGPKPRDYDFKLNRKVKDLAKMSALAYKAKGNAIVIVEDINPEAPKTKTFTDTLKKLNVGDKKVLFVHGEYNENLYLSLRNVPWVISTLLADINTYDIVNAEVLVISESAAKVFAMDEEEGSAELGGEWMKGG